MTGRLIGFCGPAGCGKSTAAAALARHGWTRVKFAAPLKDMLRAYYTACGLVDPNEVEARIEGDLKEIPDPLLAGRTPRHAMQSLGTEWGRCSIATSLWTDAFAHRARPLLDAGVDVVCDDVRFPNEADAIRALGGTIVRVLGRDKGIGNGHESERGGVQPDMRVANVGPQSTFEADVVYIFHSAMPMDN